MLKLSLMTFVLLLDAACTARTPINRAWITPAPAGNVFIHIVAPSKLAEYIKRNEIYFSIVVNECDGSGKRFPLEPMVQGARASKFDFKITGPTIEFTSMSPRWAIEKYKNPCAVLEGGGYSGARLKSGMARIQPAA